MRNYFWIFMALITSCAVQEQDNSQALASIIDDRCDRMLRRWYPASFDTVYGGFLTSFTHDFKPTDDQRKMIVTQARHTWTNAREADRYPDAQPYEAGAKRGFEFLRDAMWDNEMGGFYTLVSREGNPINIEEGKTAYGNAFAIYALAAYYKASADPAGLQLAKDAFQWLEAHSHDPNRGGYFQHLARNGDPIRRPPGSTSTSDLGYKDQNSSIHLLEAFTELYEVWPDSLVRERLQEMLFLIRDKIVTRQGYLTLFLTPDFIPISFRDSTEEVIMRHRHLDHVSFGHDVETAFLMIEASHVLGLEHDTTTSRIAKRMVDHALANGWDSVKGGFWDEAYYFKDKPGITIITKTKNWWAQAEGLNCLQMMSSLYPDDPMRYGDKFLQLWKYIDEYLIDHVYDDWYAGGIDLQPEMKTALKGHIWKGIYHQYRAMTSCVNRLSADSLSNRLLIRSGGR
jgi:cellobiose epimerase